jgi:hypothetical protein
MVTGPSTISSMRVGISAWLTNAPRCRFRMFSGTGNLPVIISHGRLADEGIMLASVCNGFDFSNTKKEPSFHPIIFYK